MSYAEWADFVYYNAGNIVTYLGVTYEALQQNINEPPTGLAPNWIVYVNPPPAAPQVLSQSGNDILLSGGGGSVDVSTTTTVAATATKTTAMTYNGGLLSTSIVGDLFVERTEIGTPLNPQPLTVNGTLDVVIDPTGSVTLTNLGSVLPSGQNVLYIDPVLGTVGQGGAPASTWVGTATSDLDMAGYNINTASAVGIKSDTGLLEFKNSAGVSKGSLSYDVVDGDIHLFADDTLDLTANTAIDVTATNGDITLATTNTNIYVNSAGGLAMTGVTGISMAIGSDIQANLAGGGNIGVGGYGADGSVFLLKNGAGSYGALNYNGANDTLNVDNGGSGISVGATGITMTPATGIVEIVGDSSIPTAPTLKLTDTNVGQSGSTTLEYNVGSGARTLLSDVSYIKTQTGAGDGMTMGTNGSTNLLFGNGFPMSIANSETLLPTDYISLPSAGGVDVITNANPINNTANGGNINLTANQDAFGSGGDLNFTTNLGASITSLSGNIALSCGGVASLGGLETQITSGLSGMTVSSGASLSLSSADGSDITATSDANITMNASSGDFVVQNGGVEHLRVSSSSVSITNVPLGLNAQNITGVNNVRYEHSYSTMGATLTASSPAIRTFNGTGLTVTLFNSDASTVGRQFIITNINAGNLTVTTVGGTQLIYSSTGAASATSRTLATGHSQIFTAIRTGVSAYGWSMV